MCVLVLVGFGVMIDWVRTLSMHAAIRDHEVRHAQDSVLHRGWGHTETGKEGPQAGRPYEGSILGPQ